MAGSARPENTHPRTLRVCAAFKKLFEGQCLQFTNHVRKNHARSFTIFVGFCADQTLNAFATRYSKDIYFIGINTGAFVVLGSASEELGRATSVNKDVGLGPLRDRFDRVQLVANVANFAMLQFLFGHELGHIAHGHTDLLADELGSNAPRAFREANASHDSGNLPAELFQSMEVDADLYATSSLVGQLARGSLCGADVLPFIESRRDILSVASIAILAMFHLFYGGHVSIATYKLQTHPLPEVRLGKFWIRVWQLRHLFPDCMIRDKPTLLSNETLQQIPENLRESIFPALRLEGRVNLLSEAARVRSNEDRFADRLASIAIVPVGGMIY